MSGQLLKLSYVAPTYHQAHLHLPATTNIHPPATQKTVKSGKMHKTQHPVKSSFHHGGKILPPDTENSSLFLIDRLAIAQCFVVWRRQLYSPIGLRGTRLYFLLRRLHHAKFLKDITEITTRPEFAFLP